MQSTLFDDESWAIFGGPGDIYRYALGRAADRRGSGSLLAVLVNPSTADARKNDHTIVKLIGFTTRWGFRSLVVVNLFAFRATDIDELKAATVDIVGPDNDAHIREQAAKSSAILCAWGSRTKMPKPHRTRPDEVCRTLQHGVPVYCLGRTISGDPTHPLMLGYDTPRLPFLPR